MLKKCIKCNLIRKICIIRSNNATMLLVNFVVLQMLVTISIIIYYLKAHDEVEDCECHQGNVVGNDRSSCNYLCISYP